MLRLNFVSMMLVYISHRNNRYFFILWVAKFAELRSVYCMSESRNKGLRMNRTRIRKALSGYRAACSLGIADNVHHIPKWYQVQASLVLMRVSSARQEKCQESPGKGNIQVIWVAALEFWVVHLIWNKTPVNGWN